MDEWTLNDLLECSVCLERLDTSSKVLPCQHTFCKKCLEEIVSTHKELRCPECRILVEAKIEELPPNVLLMRILEGMKNAPKKRNREGHVNLRPQPQQQQPPIGHASPMTLHHSPAHPSPLLASRVAPTPEHTIRSHSSPKQVQPTQPCAKALYTYQSREPGDLVFKKGDIILLKKKIDANWFHGECGGNHGVFPASYVQIIIPLPSHVPQCKALYDFRMTRDDEEGCLTFNKGEIITVIRRVDENWAEGKLADRIGIFPLAFVEMNSVARALMKLSANSQPGPSRLAPPTPTSEDTTPLIPTDHTTTSSHITMNSTNTTTNTTTATAHQPAMSGSVSSSSISSSSTTPNSSTSCSSTSSSSTAPSSPTSPPPQVEQPLPHPRGPQQQQKRHSFNVLHNSQSSPQVSHRHSAEIISPAESAVSESIPGEQSDSQITGSEESVQRHSNRHKRSGSDLAPGPPPPPQGSHQGQSSTPQVPAVYIAMYPYKPQKADELELKKGDQYTVTEKCQDGWFKGTSHRTQKSGVFPGNYVILAKAHSMQAHFNQATSSIAQIRNTSRCPQASTDSPHGTSVSSSPSRPRHQPGSIPTSGTSLPAPPNVVAVSRIPIPGAAMSYTRNKPMMTSTFSPPNSQVPILPDVLSGHPNESSERSFMAFTRNVSQIMNTPPPKPPRPHSPRQQILSINAGNLSQTPPELPPRSISPSHSPVATVSVSSSHQSPTPGSVETSPNSAHISSSWHGTGGHNQQSQGENTGPMGRSQSVVISHSMVGVSTTVSPPPNVSVRGSGHGAAGGPGSKSVDKIKEKKEKSLIRRLTMKRSKSPPTTAYSMDNPVFEDGSVTPQPVPPSAVHPVHVRSSPSSAGENTASGSSGNAGSTSHRKSMSLDAGSGGESNRKPKQLVPPVKERFRCIVPYPPNSEYELELKVGDIIYVHKKRDDGWYKGTLQRTGKTGLFPASFVESC